MDWKQGHFEINTDKSFLQADRIHAFLSQKAYWSLEIPKSVVVAAIEGSLCFGVFYLSNNQRVQIGFARIISDRATFAYLCDVYIEPEFRGQGLSKWLMKCVMDHPDLKGLRKICLGTKDAHGLYEQFGFQVPVNPRNWMEIKDNDLYMKLKITHTSSQSE